MEFHIPDFDDPYYTPRSYDPYDLEVLSDHCTKGWPLGVDSSKWWIDIPLDFSSLYIGGFCDDHDYCYLSQRYSKDSCDSHFHEQMKNACAAWYDGVNRGTCLAEALIMYEAVSLSGEANERHAAKQERRDDWSAMNYDPSLSNASSKFTRTSGRPNWFIHSEAASQRLTISGDEVVLSDDTPFWNTSVWRYYIDESIRPYTNPAKCLTLNPQNTSVRVEDCVAPNRHTVGYSGTEADLRPNRTQRFGYDSQRRRLCLYDDADFSAEPSSNQYKNECPDGDTCVLIASGVPVQSLCGSPATDGQFVFVEPTGVEGTTTSTVVTSTTTTTLIGERFMWGDEIGRDERDCFVGLVGYSKDDPAWQPINKRGTKFGVVCTECDPTCDLDGEQNGVCEFAIGLFLQKTGHASCDPASLALKRLKAKAKAKGVKIDLVTELRVPETQPGFVSDLLPFEVTLSGKQRSKTGKGTVTLAVKKPTDKDKFHFRCEPLPEGQSCP